jgi:hypothetical protein
LGAKFKGVQKVSIIKINSIIMKYKKQLKGGFLLLVSYPAYYSRVGWDPGITLSGVLQTSS